MSLQYADNGLTSEMTGGGSNAVGEAVVKAAGTLASVILLKRETTAVTSDLEFALSALRKFQGTV